jgi:Cu-processing system permease protein
MKKIKAIAVNTFKEGIRNRIMYNLVFFALAMIVFSYFIGEVSIGERIKVMQDMGLSAISIFGILIAIFVGIGLVYKEVDKRTIYTIISKPIERYQFLVGKFLGLSSMLFVQTAFMSIFFYFLLYITSDFVNYELIKAILLIYMELLVITSIALFFSSFSSPFLSAVFTMGFFIIGHTTEELYRVGQRTEEPILKWLTSFVSYFNLDHFSISARLVHGVDISWIWVGEIFMYGLFWILLFMTFSAMAFQKRDFK